MNKPPSSGTMVMCGHDCVHLINHKHGKRLINTFLAYSPLGHFSEGWYVKLTFMCACKMTKQVLFTVSKTWKTHVANPINDLPINRRYSWTGFSKKMHRNPLKIPPMTHPTLFNDPWQNYPNFYLNTNAKACNCYHILHLEIFTYNLIYLTIKSLIISEFLFLH